ncbi:hypothetical protein HUJ04_012781 [Dendroctonus ponderosae]|nr:hypothetical protein HUJ04_012781 [Dendroctonus ponderosae]KAH1030051.1 hypothetical protein HUJ05_003187 [Dendroctonus ponderosae]
MYGRARECGTNYAENASTSMDHIQEVLDKWTQIDDEIWAKVIVLERNRRVAKAYARAPVLTVNGSDDGFDGFSVSNFSGAKLLTLE